MMLSLIIGSTAMSCRSTMKLRRHTCLSCSPPSGESNGENDDKPTMAGAHSKKYQTAVRHSESFIRHLEAVKAAWPDDGLGGDDCGGGLEDDGEKPGAGVGNGGIGGGVYCTGEPHTDPSRMIQTVSDDDFDWM